jgi:hypothetical protein
MQHSSVIALLSILKYHPKYEQAHKRSDGIHPRIPYSLFPSSGRRGALLMQHAKPSHGSLQREPTMGTMTLSPTGIILTMVL